MGRYPGRGVEGRLKDAGAANVAPISSQILGWPTGGGFCLDFGSFDPCRPSQPVAQPKKVPHFMGFTRGYSKSRVSKNGNHGDNFESLQPEPQILPFLWRLLAETVR